MNRARPSTSSSSSRRGLTLLELLLAVSIAALVGAAIVGMLGAVSVGVDGRRDARTFLVQANAAQMRLSAYIVPARCVLNQQGGDLILWFDDSRQSDTVHASEVRWLLFDPEAGMLEVLLVEFPSEWSDAEKNLQDNVYPANTDWYAVLDDYESNDWISGFTILEGLESVTVSLDESTPLNSRHITYRFVFQGKASTMEAMVSAAIQQHRQPDS